MLKNKEKGGDEWKQGENSMALVLKNLPLFKDTTQWNSVHLCILKQKLITTT